MPRNPNAERNSNSQERTGRSAPGVESDRALFLCDVLCIHLSDRRAVVRYSIVSLDRATLEQGKKIFESAMEQGGVVSCSRGARECDEL